MLTSPCKKPLPSLIKMIAGVLTERATLSDKIAPVNKASIFHSSSIPQISLQEYLEMLYSRFHCSLSSFVILFIYIERIIELNKRLVLCSLTIHRLVLTSLVLAVKFHEEPCRTNKHYARVGGVGTAELGLLERKFFKLIKNRLFVPTIKYKHCVQEIKDRYQQHKKMVGLHHQFSFCVTSIQLNSISRQTSQTSVASTVITQSHSYQNLTSLDNVISQNMSNNENFSEMISFQQSITRGDSCMSSTMQSRDVSPLRLEEDLQEINMEIKAYKCLLRKRKRKEGSCSKLTQKIQKALSNMIDFHSSKMIIQMEQIIDSSCDFIRKRKFYILHIRHA